MKTTIELPIYCTDIVMTIDNDWHDVNKKWKLELDEEDYLAHAITLVNPVYTTKHEIYVLFKPQYLDYNTICHELMHVVMYVCDIKGIIPDTDNDEPLSYLQGYIGEKMFEFRDKFNLDAPLA